MHIWFGFSLSEPLQQREPGLSPAVARTDPQALAAQASLVLDHASRDAFHSPSPDSSLPLNLLLLFVNSVHISKPKGRETLRRKKTDEGSRNSRTTGWKFRENEVGALSPALLSPHPQGGVDFPKGTQGDRDRPKTRFLGISLLYPGAFPSGNHLGDTVG